MRLRVAGLGIASLASCAAPSSPPAAVPTVTVQAAVLAPAAPPTDTTLPQGAAVLASFDLGKLGGPLLEAIRQDDPAFAKQVERALELSGGARPGWLAAIGVDGSRPVGLAELGLSPEDQRVLEPLRKLAPAKDPAGKATLPGGFAVLHGALERVSTLVRGRLLVPVVDAAHVKKVIGALLRELALAPDGADAYRGGELRVELGGDATTVVVDFAAGPGSREAVAALRARPAGAPHDDPPALEDRVSRVRYSPSALAGQGFASGLAKVAGALAGGSIDPDQKERIAAQGLWESAQAYTLAGDARGAYYTSVEVSLRAGDTPEVLVSAEPGPGFVTPPDDLWKTSTSIAIQGPVQHAYDVSRAFADAWPLPGDAEGHGADAAHFIGLVRSAGWVAYPIALPSGPKALLAMEHVPPPVFKSAALLRRFERHGGFQLVAPGSTPSQVFFGLLPEGTPRAVAECALAESAPCRDRLRVDTIVPRAGSFVRLAVVERRFVVLVGGDRASVGVKLGLRDVGPVRVDLPSVPVLFGQARARPTGDRLVGTVERRGTVIVWRLGSP